MGGVGNLCEIHINVVPFQTYTKNIVIGEAFFKKYFLGYNYEENKLILGKTKDNVKIC